MDPKPPTSDPRRIYRAASGSELIFGRVWRQTFSGASGYSLKFYDGAPVRFWRQGRGASLNSVAYLLVNQGEEYGFEVTRPAESRIATAFFAPTEVAAAWESLTTAAGRQLDLPCGSVGRPEFSAVQHRAAPELRPFFAAFAAERNEGAISSHRLEEILAELLLLALAPEAELQAVRASFSPARQPQREEMLRRISQARSFIEANAGADLSVSEMSRAASLSTFHFIRRFKTVCGCSPVEFQRRVRLERAAEALLARPKALTEIALECGYADLSAFSRGFRRRFGVSPTAYRQMRNGGQARDPAL